MSSMDSNVGNGYKGGKSTGSKRRKKKKRAMTRVFTCLFLLLAVISGVFTAKINYEVKDVFATIDRDTDSDFSDLIDDSDLLSDSDIVNILLIGSDKRATWSQQGRSDSTMIATVDNKNKQLKLTSLMRDMYVEVPGHGKNKFNAAYSLGGVELLYETIAYNFNIKLDGYVLVDFEAFKKLINEVGGVTVNLNQKEYEYLTTAYHRSSVLDVVPGVQTMNGEQALAYTRIRQVGNNDFERTQRQRNVMTSLFKKAKAMPLTEVLGLGKTVLPYVTTDLTDAEILKLGKTVFFMGTTEIKQQRIPVNNSYTDEKVGKALVLGVDLEKNQQALSEFIFNKVEE